MTDGYKGYADRLGTEATYFLQQQTQKTLMLFLSHTHTYTYTWKHSYKQLRFGSKPLPFLLYFTSHTVVYFSLLSPSVATFPYRQPQLSCFLSARSFHTLSQMAPAHNSDGLLLNRKGPHTPLGTQRNLSNHWADRQRQIDAICFKLKQFHAFRWCDLIGTNTGKIIIRVLVIVSYWNQPFLQTGSLVARKPPALYWSIASHDLLRVMPAITHGKNINIITQAK